MIKAYVYGDRTQLSPHFRSSEFQCKCGKAHDTLISDELVSKLEELYAKLNCSKIIVTSGYRCVTHEQKCRWKQEQDSIPKELLPISAATDRTENLSAVRLSAVPHRI